MSDPDHVRRHADTIAAAPALGVDTEFVRERTYFPRPGLVQFSDGRDVWLVDPVGLADGNAMTELVGALMRDGATPKILHSTGEDLEVLELIGQAAPVPLFDTQRAAALLGWPLQLRYELLAADLLGTEFPGGLGRNNWLKRPLPEAWIEYAANDVIALPGMRLELAERLEQRERLAWLEEDCRRIIERSHQVPAPEIRIKGAAGLSDEQLERLARLARWREKRAAERDLPRGFIVRDGALLALARAGGDDFERAMEAAGDDAPRSGRVRDELRQVVSAAPEAYERPPDLRVLSGDDRARIKALQAGVRSVAEDLGVEPALLASRRDLTRWIQGAECDWLEGWRGEVLAHVLPTHS